MSRRRRYNRHRSRNGSNASKTRELRCLRTYDRCDHDSLITPGSSTIVLGSNAFSMLRSTARSLLSEEDYRTVTHARSRKKKIRAQKSKASDRREGTLLFLFINNPSCERRAALSLNLCISCACSLLSLSPFLEFSLSDGGPIQCFSSSTDKMESQ